MSPTAAVLPLVLFMALMLAASLHGLAASGHFPRSHRPHKFARDPGLLILFGSIAIVIAGLAIGIAAALRLTPWYAAIIGGGLSILTAPLLLQRLRVGFVDGRGALIVFAAAVIVSALLLVAMVMY